MPDLAYFTKGQVARLAATHAPFAPTFVVEALSPSTADKDTGQKFASYELHQVQEYWILDPEKLDHHFYRREGDMLTPASMAWRPCAPPWSDGTRPAGGGTSISPSTTAWWPCMNSRSSTTP